VTNDLFKDWGPRWSPDGDKIAFYTNEGGSYEIWVMNRDGTGRTRLTDTPQDDTPQRPTWSPDGNRIATWLTDSRRAFIIDANKQFDEQTEEPIPEVPGGNGSFQPTDWSADGRWLLGTVGPAPDSNDLVSIWRLEVETGEYEFLADGTAATWMADGRRVLFRIDEPFGFYVVDTVSRSVEPVSVPPAAESMVLSPDNRRVYLVLVEEESDIWMLEIGGQ